MALLFVWNDSYKTGIEIVDSQHRKLVDLINELYTQMGKGQGNQALAKTLDELVKYTVTHFTAEERLLEKAGYPDLPAHRKVHEDFTNRVKQMQRDVASGKFVMSVSLATFLKEWLSGHILGTDKKYVPHLTAKGIK